MGCRSAAAAGMLLLALAMARTGHATIDSTDIDVRALDRVSRRSGTLLQPARAPN